MVMEYRYKKNEVEDMKKNIITHMEHDGNKTAWRLRLALEGLAYCCKSSKKERQKRFRRLALYELLTNDDVLKPEREQARPA